jgi:hypothetical protein
MMYELTDADLDAVSAGQNNPLQTLVETGLVNVGAQISDILNLTGNNISVSVLDNNQVELRNILNGNTVQVGAGAVVAILGGAAGGLVRQLA